MAESAPTYSRPLGLTEASYFLPSREDGANDLGLHLGFTAPLAITVQSRVQLVWALLRLRHPLLAARVDMHDYDDIRFVYTCPASPQDAVRETANALQYRPACSKDEFVDNFVLGPRILSNERLSFLYISRPGDVTAPLQTPTPCEEKEGYDFEHAQHELMICTTHYLADGIAIHQLTNDFSTLLGGQLNESELMSLVAREWEAQYKKTAQNTALPASLEDRLPATPRSKFQEAALRVDYENTQRKQIGGQVFPRQRGKPRRTTCRVVALDESRTIHILKACKDHKVSLPCVLFALCNIAWIRTSSSKGELPALFYSAMSLRTNFVAEKAIHDSYLSVAIGYFNITLPSFMLRSLQPSSTFWYRARQTKSQISAAIKSPMLIARSQNMALERADRAKAFAKEDDAKAAGIWSPPATPRVEKKEPAPFKAPSAALLGISCLGSLDSIYKHNQFGAIKLNWVTSGLRQRAGGMMLFSYTFLDKLWLNMTFDENGYEKASFDAFWANVLSGMDEFIGV
ncbi:hypothetical protein CYLTODRAFT_397528 [Cylindrobasidium torrendii FP15055 ss-10]|uniref:CoA-dependent acyltransferase n=1 Tax=Cylindrobasidium torrendii FP15055 ss-10 TaxID=1314674 RepID=A0A0D7BAM2_9AGAR|nr:hypothetical protein CYLTODRAFT_397528 [Cylindrobasidium torrendii FP15055 ss-10]